MLTECRLGFFRSFSVVAAAVALLFVAPQTMAQPSAPAPQAAPSGAGDDDWAPPNDSDVQQPPASAEVPVVAPQLRSTRGMRPTGAPGPVRMSTNVRFDDLDLRTPHGADALRARLRSAATDVCEQLAVAYPVYELRKTSCERTAIRNAAVRAKRLIRQAGGGQNP